MKVEVKRKERRSEGKKETRKTPQEKQNCSYGNRRGREEDKGRRKRRRTRSSF